MSEIAMPIIAFFVSITPIVAVFAAVQPWLRDLWRLLFKKGKVEIYETGTVEIGYTSFGPTIGINGTLRAFNKDVQNYTYNFAYVKYKKNLPPTASRLRRDKLRADGIIP